MKKISLTAIFAVLLFTSKAQVSVAILPFTPGAGGYSDNMRASVVTALQEAKIFNVIPTDDWGISTGDPDTKKVDMGLKKAKEGGTQYVISGVVLKAMVGPFLVMNEPDFNFTLKIYDVATGQYVATTIIKVPPTYCHEPGANEALDKGCLRVTSLTKTWAFGAFPKTREVVKVTKRDDKHGATRTMVAAGSDGAVKNNDQFNIVEYTTEKVGDRLIERTVNVGIGEIMFVDDANFSTMAVKRGGKLVEEKLAAGVRLFLTPLL